MHARCQVCALSQLLLDPYYRTVAGFRDLVEKDFVHFGHQFRTRLAVEAGVPFAKVQPSNGYASASHLSHCSPVFLQVSLSVYLRCVQQFV